MVVILIIFLQDKIAAMVGDTSFKIKPRLGDYVLLNRNQGHLAKTTLFPCPHPVLGKGMLNYSYEHITRFYLSLICALISFS